MATRTTKAMLNRVYNSHDISQLAQLGREIEAAQKTADGLARTIAGALYVIHGKKLYEIESYKNIYEYAEQVHGISRGTCSDAINVFKRFGDLDNKRELRPEYQAYAFRTLIMMKKLDDDAIARLRLTPSITSAEVKQRIQDYLQCQNLLEGDWTIDTVHQILNEQAALEDKQSEDGSPADTTNDSTAELDVPPISEQDDVQKQRDNRTLAYNIMGEKAYREMSEREGDNLDDAISDYLDEFMTFPKRTININEIADKDVITQIKTLLGGVRDGEYEIIITA